MGLSAGPGGLEYLRPLRLLRVLRPQLRTQTTLRCRGNGGQSTADETWDSL